MNFEEYKKNLIQQWPSMSAFLNEKSWKFPLFPEVIPLSFSSFQSMKKVIETLFLLKQDSEYVSQILNKNSQLVHFKQDQDSVLMAYDFHIDQEGVPKLIEVNTNASGFLMVNSFYQFCNWNYKQSLKSLASSFKEEWKQFQLLNGLPESPIRKAVIIDENFSEQKMFVEFLMYQDFFESMGWSAEICEISSLKIQQGSLVTENNEPIDFVYNRSTDFYFKKYPNLLEAYNNHLCCISPHPREYLLLSDKRRLCDWFSGLEQWPLLKTIQTHLIPSYLLQGEEVQNEAWVNRKKYLFKSTTGHGGKIVYRGSNLTRKKFDFVCGQSSLFQEYIPPSIWLDAKEQEWKLDFRVFVYKNEIQQVAARCYKGQITNFTESGSGWALVKIEDPQS